MSRIGQQIIVMPQGVTVTIDGSKVSAMGPRGNESLEIPAGIDLAIEKDRLTVKRTRNSRELKALHGLTRQLINNIIIGVSNGFKRQLEMKGTGYRAEVNGNDLVLSVGFSHPVRVPAPLGIKFQVEKNIMILIEGNDKQLVGEVAANIRAIRKPEPYKGKGIRYSGEKIRLKPGKAVKATAAA